jgi:hypothetical protein
LKDGHPLTIAVAMVKAGMLIAEAKLGPENAENMVLEAVANHFTR